MWSIERLKLFAAMLACVSVMNVLADVVLAYLHAGMGWYYGVAYFLAMLCVFRVMSIPRRCTEMPPRSPIRTSRVNPPDS
jgi:hypothetical protein